MLKNSSREDTQTKIESAKAAVNLAILYHNVQKQQKLQDSNESFLAASRRKNIYFLYKNKIVSKLTQL
jgi:hypothetical protein